MTDILISDATVITMDADRRVIDRAAVAVAGDRIVEIGPSDELMERHQAVRRIDGSGMVVMPGLIDCHAHAGHGLVKTMGGDHGPTWYDACETIYTTGSSADFWRAEAHLSALERVKCGVTCGVSLLGGGADIMRTDEEIYGDRHCQAVSEVGIRSVLAVGPCRPPFPRRFTRWQGDTATPLTITFADQLQCCDALIERWHGASEGRIEIAMNLPVFRKADIDVGPAALAELVDQSTAARDLGRERGVRLTQDGHRDGSIEIADRLFDLLGPDLYLSHCIDMTDHEIARCRETGTKIVHNPSAVAAIVGRCPVPELIEAGVTVAIGSDGAAPNRSLDLIRQMFQCMHYHRTYFKDPRYMPPGKVMEMVTIDAAKVLGLEEEIGSLEVGKKADIILIDMAKPHLYPPNMPLYRIPYFANGADVDTVIVDGRVLMEGRAVKTVDEATLLAAAARETEIMIERSGLEALLETPEGFWRGAKYPDRS
jgi:cytosine/adenosine deaminase-related metal-dependent hydrolase